MSMHIYKSGANRSVTPYIYKSGANRLVQAVYVYKSGANRLVYSAANIIGDSIDAIGSFGANARYRVRDNGYENRYVQTDANSPIESDFNLWVNPAQASSFEVMATILASSGSYSGTFGTWLSPSSADWSAHVSGSGLSSHLSLQIDIRPTGGSIVDTAIVYLDANT